MSSDLWKPASSDLIWAVVRTQSSFIVKRPAGIGGVQFSREPNNLLNLNSYKYSGLANNKAVGIVPAERGVVLNTRSTKSRKNISTNISRGPRRSALSVANIVARTGYRPDLRSAALARLSAIVRSQRLKKAGKKEKKEDRRSKGKRALKKSKAAKSA